jgi:hypothetical protein
MEGRVHEGHEMDVKQAGYEAYGPGSSSSRAHDRDLVNMVINRRPLTVFLCHGRIWESRKPYGPFS